MKFLKALNEKITGKVKGITALAFFVLALIWDLIATRNSGHMFSDGCVILLFLMLCTLCNMWFSKWSGTNLFLIADLAVGCIFGFTLLQCFAYAVDIGDNKISPAGLTMTVKTAAVLISILALFALLVIHYILFHHKSKVKGFLFTVFYTLLTLLCMILPIFLRITYEIMTE